MNEQAVAPASKRDIRALLAQPATIAKLQQVATKHLTAERLARIALSAVNKTPGLLNCTPESVLTCVLQCSQYGVEPDGRHAHLIPYKGVCTLIIDWKGLVAIGRRNGVVGIVPDIICEEDEFEYYRDEQGTHFKHRPKFGHRGAVIGAYSVCSIDGQFDCEVMTTEEIEAIKSRSQAKNFGPWVTDWNEMAKKTAIRRHSKRWPLGADAEAMAADGDVSVDVEPARAATFDGLKRAEPAQPEPLPQRTPRAIAPAVPAPAPAEPSDDIPFDEPKAPEPAPEPQPAVTLTGSTAPKTPSLGIAPEPPKDPAAPVLSRAQKTAENVLVGLFAAVPGATFDDVRDWLAAALNEEDFTNVGTVGDLSETAATTIANRTVRLRAYLTKIVAARSAKE